MIFAVLAASALFAANSSPTDFVVPTLKSFDGEHWAGLTLGQTSSDDIKKQYRPLKGAIRPDAIRLAKSPVTVDALLTGRGANSRLAGFRIEYANDRDLRDIAAEFGSKPEFFYQRARREDWRIAWFRNSGAAAALDLVDQFRVLYLFSPERQSTIFSNYTPTEEPVQVVVDPYVGKPKVATFGKVSVQYEIDGLGFKHQSQDQEDWERYLKGLTARGSCEFRPDASGEAKVRLQTQYEPKRGGTLTITIDFRGECAYGAVSASAKRFASLPKSDDPTSRANLELQSDIAYAQAMVAVRGDIEAEIEARVRALGPAPANVLRLQALDRLLNDLCTPIVSVKDAFTFGSIEFQFKDQRSRKSSSRLDAFKDQARARLSQAKIAGLVFDPTSPGRVILTFEAELRDQQYLPRIGYRLEAHRPDKSLRFASSEALPPTGGDIATQEFVMEGTWLKGLQAVIDKLSADIPLRMAKGNFDLPLEPQASAGSPVISGSGPFAFGAYECELTGSAIDEKVRPLLQEVLEARIKNIDDPSRDRYAVIDVGLVASLDRFKGQLKYLPGAPGKLSLRMTAKVDGSRLRGKVLGSIEAARDGVVIKVSDESDIDVERSAPFGFQVRSLRFQAQYVITQLCQRFDQRLAERKISTRVPPSGPR